MTNNHKKIAIFGATGYVGLLFVNKLLRAGWKVKLFVRNKRLLEHLKESESIESCDVELSQENTEIITRELKDCDVLYYLIHLMQDDEESSLSKGFDIAKHVAVSAKDANVKQIVYLGGLGSKKGGNSLSKHLGNRHKIAVILASTGVQVTELRAAVIIGPGSVSFEILKALGTDLPFIPKLTYATGLCQPIDIEDVLEYLLYVYKREEYYDEVIEIGSDAVLTYPEMIQKYSNDILNKKIPVLNLPFANKIFTKKIVAHMIAFYSAVPYSVAKPLVDGITSDAIVKNFKHEELRSIRSISYDESIRKAHSCSIEGRVESFWSIPKPNKVLSDKKEKFLYVNSHDERKNFLCEQRSRNIGEKDVENIFQECLKIGGEYGYWSPKWMWGVRALVDKVIGGTGLESGKQARNKEIRIGDMIDFWVVSDYLNREDFKVFTLKARLKSPGSSWLQFAIVKDASGQWKFLLRAYFKPDGISGYLYWYSLWFIHKYIFTVMIDNIVKKAKNSS